MGIFLHLGKFVFGVLFLILYCEVIIYYVVLLQCSWPKLEKKPSDNFSSNQQPLKVMLLADTHLLGPVYGHWFDKLRREWQMYRTFQTTMTLHKPNVVFVLGDLFDEGLWSDEDEFMFYVNRFHSIFHVPEDTKLYVVPGNHDMGFHYWIREDLKNRFESAFNTTPVEKIDIHGNIFILINSMAMEGDGCFLCKSATDKLRDISIDLSYNKNKDKHITHTVNFQEYNKPVLLQHFPMYRKSDKNCNEPDSASTPEKQELFTEGWECLSKAASKQAVFTPDRHAVSKCYMPRENTVISIYIVGGFILLICILFTKKKFVSGIKYKNN